MLSPTWNITSSHEKCFMWIHVYAFWEWQWLDQIDRSQGLKGGAFSTCHQFPLLDIYFPLSASLGKAVWIKECPFIMLPGNMCPWFMLRGCIMHLGIQRVPATFLGSDHLCYFVVLDSGVERELGLNANLHKSQRQKYSSLPPQRKTADLNKI